MSVSLNYTFFCGDRECVEVGGQFWVWGSCEGKESGQEVFPEGTQVCEQRHSNALPCHATDIREPFLSRPFSVGLKPLSLRALWMGFRGSG